MQWPIDSHFDSHCCELFFKFIPLGVGPFQLLNFDGTKNDVATLAHESGHGCHDILAYKQGYLQYHPPLTLAEVRH